jgi:hypothetical protein
VINRENFGLIFGAVGMALSTYLYFQFKTINSTVDISIQDLSNKTKVDVEKSIVDKAIQRAVDREVAYQVQHVSQSTVNKIATDLSIQVKRAVNASYSDIQSSVSDEMSKQIAKIDMNELKNDVRTKAKQAILDKFDGSLDDVLSDFNENLKSVTKIYQSIASSMNPKQEKETILKFG